MKSLLRILVLLVIVISGCKKAEIPNKEEPLSIYSFEITTNATHNVRYTTDMIKFVDVLGVTGDWKYEWEQLPSDHTPHSFQVGFDKCCIIPITLTIKKDGKILVTKTMLETQYTIIY